MHDVIIVAAPDTSPVNAAALDTTAADGKRVGSARLWLVTLERDGSLLASVSAAMGAEVEEITHWILCPVDHVFTHHHFEEILIGYLSNAGERGAVGTVLSGSTAVVAVLNPRLFNALAAGGVDDLSAGAEALLGGWPRERPIATLNSSNDLCWHGPKDQRAFVVPVVALGRNIGLEGGPAVQLLSDGTLCALPEAPTLSVVIPSLGAPTLPRTLDSILRQRLIPGDQVIVMGDGPSDYFSIAEGYRDRLPIEHYFFEDHNVGNPQRNWAIENAVRADYLVWMDEDDVFMDGAFDVIRSAAGASPGRPLMFRVVTPDRRLLWETPELQFGAIDGHEFVTPNVPSRLGRWARCYEGDYFFMLSTLAKWPPGSLIWHDEPIAFCRPDGPPPWKWPVGFASDDALAASVDPAHLNQAEVPTEFR